MAELRAETRYAKQLFLYGAGDGVPIRSVVKLSEVSGVHVETIRRHIATWEKEAEELLAGTSECGLAVRLSKETLEANERDMDFIRTQINQIKYELETTEEAVAKMEDWLDRFVDDDDRHQALKIFEQYLAGSSVRSSLRSQFIAMKKLWDEKSAIDGLRDVALVREKEIQKGKAKLEMKRLENAPVRNANPLENSVFAKPRISSKD